MQEHDGLTPAEHELENALRSLQPVAARVDTTAAAYEAGRRSADRQLRLWRAAFAAMLLVGIGTWIVPRGMEQRVAPIAVEQNATGGRIVARPAAPTSLVALQRALRDGEMEWLPATDLPPVQRIRSDELF